MLKHKRIPVILITGYLGSGKTTVLNYLLSQEKRRIALVVNDMGEINVDAKLLADGNAKQLDVGMIELSNGCICCTLRDEFMTELDKLSNKKDLEAIFVEASGVSDPASIAEAFLVYEEAKKKSRIYLSSIATVVDVHRIYSEFLEDLVSSTEKTDDDPDIINLVMDQIEFCNTIIMNKCDLLDNEQLDEVTRIIKQLQPEADMIYSVQGKVNIDKITSGRQFDYDKAMNSSLIQKALAKNETGDSLDDEYGIRTLLIVCEEGEEEYDEGLLKELNTDKVIIEEEEDFTEERLTLLDKEYKPERIIIEYNGMWDRRNVEFPWYWDDIMEIAVADASTFKLYADNMRSLLAEHVRRAYMVLFNRCDEVRDKLAGYRRNILAINGSAAFVFKGAEGDIILDPNENLPYDIDEDELTLDDNAFFVFCIDSLERYELYAGKTIHFKARAYEMKDGGDMEFVAGRMVMTCCEADMSFVGVICSYYKAYELENKAWIDVTGIVRIQYDELTGNNIPVVRVTELNREMPPVNEIIVPL